MNRQSRVHCWWWWCSDQLVMSTAGHSFCAHLSGIGRHSSDPNAAPLAITRTAPAAHVGGVDWSPACSHPGIDFPLLLAEMPPSGSGREAQYHGKLGGSRGSLSAIPAFANPPGPLALVKRTGSEYTAPWPRCGCCPAMSGPRPYFPREQAAGAKAGGHRTPRQSESGGLAQWPSRVDAVT
jgi:hypothetical protein